MPPIVLDGTTGITTPGLTNTGTETLVNLTTTGNTTLGDATTDTLTVGVTGIVKDASGNVGIGTASPNANSKLDVAGISQASSASYASFQLYNSGLASNRYFRIAYDSANNLVFNNVNNAYNSSTEFMRIDSSGNVGIGYVPSGTIEKLSINATTGTGIGFNTNSTYTNWVTAKIAPIDFGVNFTGGLAFYTNGGSTAATAPTERMRIDSSGNLLVGTTSAVSVGAGTHILSLRASSTSWGVGPTSSFGSFYVKNGSSYGVVLTTTATSWASDSDERKKTEITPFVNAVEKVCSLRAGTGSYLSDANNISRSFLIAQDVQKVLPQAIDIGEDADKTLMLRYTDLIPLLVASIKELKSTIDTQANTITSLTTRITALEAK